MYNDPMRSVGGKGALRRPHDPEPPTNEGGIVELYKNAAAEDRQHAACVSLGLVDPLLPRENKDGSPETPRSPELEGWRPCKRQSHRIEKEKGQVKETSRSTEHVCDEAIGTVCNRGEDPTQYTSSRWIEPSSQPVVSNR
jgi:hypothetical protein